MALLYAIELAERTNESYAIYSEEISDVSPNAVSIAWRHYRATNSECAALHGLPLDGNSLPTNDIPLVTEEETLAFSVLKNYFHKFATTDTDASIKVTTSAGCAMIMKAPHMREKFLISVTPDTTSIGEIIFYYYIRQ